MNKSVGILCFCVIACLAIIVGCSVDEKNKNMKHLVYTEMLSHDTTNVHCSFLQYKEKKSIGGAFEGEDWLITYMDDSQSIIKNDFYLVRIDFYDVDGKDGSKESIVRGGHTLEIILKGDGR